MRQEGGLTWDGLFLLATLAGRSVQLFVEKRRRRRMEGKKEGGA